MASNYFFIPYKEKTNINYIYLLYLYSIAKRDKEGLKVDGYVDYRDYRYLIKSEIIYKNYNDLEC